MSVTYELKNASAQDAQKKVIELVLEYNYTGNATPASTAVTIQNPDVLMIETESTSASGTTDLSGITSTETLTYPNAPDDSAGEYNALVRVGQKIKRLVGVQVFNKYTGAIIPTTQMTAPADGLIGETTAGDDDLIAVDIDHGADLTSADLDLVMKVYFVLD